MELISKEINGVTVFLNKKDTTPDPDIPTIEYNKDLNKYEFRFVSFDYCSYSDCNDATYLTYYFDSIQDIIKFLGLDIEEEK